MEPERLWSKGFVKLEKKAEGVVNGDSEVGDCDEVICAG